MPSAIGRKKPRLSGPVAAVTNGNDGVLPADVLYDVLLRLPANELCRLRLVCRSWRSLTSDPGFAKAHASRHPLVAAIHNHTSQVHLLDLSGNVVRRLHLPAGYADDLNTQLDQLCVSVDTDFSSYVISSGTGEVVATVPTGGGYFKDNDVPINNGGFVPDGEPLLRYSSPYLLLGHVPSTGEYKVLRTTGYYWPEFNTHACNVMTLGGGGGGGGRWRPRPSPVGAPHPSLWCRVVIDGVAYFMSRQPDDIFSFDLATEEWRPNALRGPLSSGGKELEFRHDLKSLQLLALNGCLVVAHHKNGDCSMDLWFLVDMDVDKGVWTKRYSIPCVPRREAHESWPPCPLQVLNDGRIVIWAEQRERVLKAYDPRTNMYANLTRMKGYSDVCMHLGSLLCPGIQSW